MAAMPVKVSSTELTPQQSYLKHADTLRDIIANDHFGGEMPTQIIDQWMKALEPSSKLPLPPGVKGFYGSDLKSSMPIEIARGSYKYITHEIIDKKKVDKYASRMLIALSMLDSGSLAQKDPNLGVLALWHKALAQVRLPENAEGLAETLQQYEALRPQATLSDSKLPQPERLKERLQKVAGDLENEAASVWLASWLSTKV